MNDVFEVLRQKEKDLARVREEIFALHLVLPLLIEDEAPRGEVTDIASNSSRYGNRWPLELHAGAD
jgi:hypothetical protein